MVEKLQRRLSKKVVFDPEIKLDRICWVLETSCPSCSEPLEVIFDDLPTEAEMKDAEKMPCDDCAGVIYSEDEKAGDEIDQLFIEDDHHDHKS
jgi:hypothetical protein